MSTVIAVYIFLLAGFLIISSLILRHAIKFSYLSHRFKYIVGLFIMVALSVILFSVFLLFKMDTGSTHVPYDSGSSDGNSENLNF